MKQRGIRVNKESERGGSEKNYMAQINVITCMNDKQCSGLINTVQFNCDCSKGKLIFFTRHCAII